MKHILDLSPFLVRYSLDETIDVLDDMLFVLVQNTELKNAENTCLIYHYMVIKELRDYFKFLENISDADQD